MRLRLLFIIGLSACATTPPPRPGSLGPCLLSFDQVGGEWFVTVDRDPGPGYASGAFLAEAHLFLDTERTTFEINADVTRLKIPTNKPINSVTTSYCEAFEK